MGNEYIVEMKGISKHFGSVQALNAVDLELRQGEILGLVGDNAAGKSTLMKILAGAYMPDNGEIILEGPQLRAYKEKGNRTISIIGFRSADLVFWEDKFARYSDELILTTDDGSRGMKGFVTHALAKVLDAHPEAGLIMAIGPLVMMCACTELARPRGVPVLVSLKSIMVDGTGMCGSCRVTIDGLMRFPAWTAPISRVRR